MLANLAWLSRLRWPPAGGGTWLAVAAGAVVLLAAAAATQLERPGPALRAAVQPEVSRRAALETCSEGAVLFHDVRWAAACMVLAERHAACMKDAAVTGEAQLGRSYCDRTFGQGDGSADCVLPDASAAALDRLLQHAEQQCLAEYRGEARR